MNPPNTVLEIISDDFTTEQIRGMNIRAGEMVGQLVRTTLGPQGLDKLLIDDDGMAIVTNNGSSIIKEQVDHPVGNMVVESAISQENEINDGTTATAILTSSLLSEARGLLSKGIHPASIVRGFDKACQHAVSDLERIASFAEVSDDEVLIRVAETAMTGRGAQQAEDVLAEIVVDAIRYISDGFDDEPDVGNIRLMKSQGGRVEHSHVLEGVVLSKERLTVKMPYSVEQTGVLTLREDVGMPGDDSNISYIASNPSELQKTANDNMARLQRQINKLTELGVGAVVCGNKIADSVGRALAQSGIYAVHRVTPEDIDLINKTAATHSVPNLNDVNQADVGYARAVFEREIDNEPKTIFRGDSEGTSATIVLHGVSRKLVDELARAVRDALESVRLTIAHEKVLPGGGATEIELAMSLEEVVRREPSRDQFAIEAYADALEIIPFTLAGNAGRDGLDSVIKLRRNHHNGKQTMGIGADGGDFTNMINAGIVEPIQIKQRVLENATDAVNAILRVDGILPRQEGIKAEPE